MDDLEFIKKHMPKKVTEDIQFDDANHMLRTLLFDVAEIHLESEAEDPEGPITELLHDLVVKYRSASVRRATR